MFSKQTHFVSMRPLSGVYGHVDFEHDHLMVRETSERGPSCEKISDVTVSHDDVLDQAPVFLFFYW